MKKIVTYLSERDYIENRYKPIDLEQYKYWMGILGEEFVKKICDQNSNFLSYLKNEDYRVQIPIKRGTCSAPTVRSVQFKRCGAPSL